MNAKTEQILIIAVGAVAGLYVCTLLVNPVAGALNNGINTVSGQLNFLEAPFKAVGSFLSGVADLFSGAEDSTTDITGD
jgi:hypothetical protein